MSLDIKVDGNKLIIAKSRFTREQVVEIYRSMMESAHFSDDLSKNRHVKNIVYNDLVEEGNATYNPVPGVRFSIKRFGATTTFELGGEYKPNLEPLTTRLREYLN